MTISSAFAWSVNKKVAHSDADILLAYTLKKEKSFVYTHPEHNLSDAQAKKFKKLISRRVKDEPIAYLIGHKEFYGLDFIVNKHVLIPRPESELIVEEVIKQLKKYPISNIPASPARFARAHARRAGGQYPILLIDLGTGTGCLPIAVLKNLSTLHYPLSLTALAIDISSKALAVARANARLHNLNKKIKFLRGNLLKPIISCKCLNVYMFKCLNVIITGNLPYLPNKIYRANYPMLKYEPRLALTAKNNGLYYYQKLINQINLLLTRYSLSVACFFEFLPCQTKPLLKLISQHLPAANITIKKDLAGKNRLLMIKLQQTKNS